MSNERNPNNMFITGTGLLSDDIKPVRPLLPPILNFGEIMMYYAPSGCIDGESEIYVSRGGGCRVMKLRDLWLMYNRENYNGLKQNGRTCVRSMLDGRIGLNPIKEVHFMGFKETLRIKCANKILRCTPDHEIFTKRGWVQAKDITTADFIASDDGVNPKPSQLKHIKPRYKMVGLPLSYPWGTVKKTTKYKRRELHILVCEAEINGYSDVDSYIQAIRSGIKVNVINSKEFHVHHKDSNTFNNDRSNLEILTPREHLVLHGKVNYKNFNQGDISYRKVTSIKEGGVRDVYDIVCEDPYRNFVANGLVVHNCGKTWLSLLLGLMACHGGKFLKWQFAQKVKVLFLDGEMGVNSLSNRYKSIRSSLSLEMDDNNFIACYPCVDNEFETPNISDPRVQAFYNKKIVTEGIQLLVIDSYSTCTAMLHDRDNEFAQWERVKKWLIRLKAHGISVVLVHHTNKGKQEQAGAEDRTRLLDTQMFLSPSRFPLREEGTAFDISIEKSRNFHGDDTKKLHVQVLDVFSKSIIRCFDYEEMLIRNIGVESLPIGDIAAKYGISRWEAKHYKNITKGLVIPTNDQDGGTPITDDEIEEVF